MRELPNGASDNVRFGDESYVHIRDFISPFAQSPFVQSPSRRTQYALSQTLLCIMKKAKLVAVYTEGVQRS
jgi:hypothetical protein